MPHLTGPMPEALTEAGLSRFGAVATGHVGAGRVPGLVTLVARGDQVHVEALGSLAVGGPPVRRDSQFRIASTTKPVTAVVTLALAHEGLLDLDEPVDRLLPELADRQVLRRMDGPLEDTVPADRAVTARDLLTFTFGFGMDIGMFTAHEPWPVVAAADRLHLCAFGPPDPEEQPDPDTWISALGSLPLMAQPGERWLYNTGASVLGVLVARAAGAPLGEVMRTRVFDPLRMADTAFWASDPTRLATTYLPTPDGLVVWDEPDGAWAKPPAFGDGAAGLVSTADDLLALARMFLAGGHPILPPDAVAEMTTDQMTPAQFGRDGQGILNGRGWGFCQSVVTEGPRAGAFGWDGGLGTSWLVDPAEDLTIVVLTQRMFETAQAPEVHCDLQSAGYAAIPRSTRRPQ